MPKGEPVAGPATERPSIQGCRLHQIVGEPPCERGNAFKCVTVQIFVKGALLGLALLLAACGGGAGSVSQASPTAGANPTPSAAEPPSPSAIVACPATVRNVGGQYSFTCPAGWTYVNCDEAADLASYTWLINPQGCQGEEYGARLLVVSFPGAQGPAGYLGSLQSSRNVTIASVSGTRRVYLVTASNPLPPPQDTVQVLYTFATGGRTLYLEYDRYPGDVDETSTFDIMVTQTLAFSY